MMIVSVYNDPENPRKDNRVVIEDTDTKDVIEISDVVGFYRKDPLEGKIVFRTNERRYEVYYDLLETPANRHRTDGPEFEILEGEGTE